MTAYIIRRVLLIIPTVFFALSFLFLLFFTLPGDPANLIAGGADRVPDPIQVEQINERYGFNDPLIVQFKNYWQRVLHWDLGESFQTGRSVNDILGERTVNSLRLAFWAVLIEIVVGIAWASCPPSVGTRCPIGSPRSSPPAASAMPVFVLGFILQYIFAVVPNKQGWPEWMAAAHLAARPRHLGLLLHPHRGAVALPDAAGHHAGRRVHRPRRPHDPRLDARGDARRLHAHGAGQGPG